MPKQQPEQFCLQSQAREHFPFHNLFPRCMIIPHIHRKQKNKPLNMLQGIFSQGPVYKIACLLKELFSCFLFILKLAISHKIKTHEKFSLEHDHLINILLKKVKEKIRHVCLDLIDYYNTLKGKKGLKRKFKSLCLCFVNSSQHNTPWLILDSFQPLPHPEFSFSFLSGNLLLPFHLHYSCQKLA